jgi:hypothetical protein
MAWQGSYLNRVAYPLTAGQLRNESTQDTAFIEAFRATG